MPLVFHRHGNRIEHYNRAWRTACTKAGFPGKLMHDKRRTAARNMDRAGVPRPVAKQIMGHKTDSMYNRYNIVNEGDVRESMAQTQGLPRGAAIRTNTGQSNRAKKSFLTSH